MQRCALVLLLTLSSTTAGCEKAGSEAKVEIKASGALTNTERHLLGHLPDQANLVFGGKYDKFLAYWENSPLKDMMRRVAPGGNLLGDWMDCLAEVEDVEIAGTLEVGSRATVRMVFRGLTRDFFAECSREANLELKPDADGKYLQIRTPDMLGGFTDTGYYFADENTAILSTHVDFASLAAGKKPVAAERAEIERDLERAKASPAADSEAIKKLIESADRSKSFWFCGTAEGTSLISAIRNGHGWIEVESDALMFAFAIELADQSLAKEAVTAFSKAKGEIDKVPDNAFPNGKAVKAALKAFLSKSTLVRSGSTLRGRFELDNEVLSKLLGLMEMGLGMGM